MCGGTLNRTFRALMVCLYTLGSGTMKASRICVRKGENTPTTHSNEKKGTWTVNNTITQYPLRKSNQHTHEHTRTHRKEMKWEAESEWDDHTISYKEEQLAHTHKHKYTHSNKHTHTHAQHTDL